MGLEEGTVHAPCNSADSSVAYLRIGEVNSMLLGIRDTSRHSNDSGALESMPIDLWKGKHQLFS